MIFQSARVTEQVYRDMFPSSAVLLSLRLKDCIAFAVPHKSLGEVVGGFHRTGPPTHSLMLASKCL